MTYNEIFNSEKRTKENVGLIHLYYEGAWWRAYEWSAYLLSHYPFVDSTIQPLKPTKKETTLNNNGLIFVGLQLKSFKKYLPFITNTEQFEEIQNKHIILNVNEMFSLDVLENYEKLLNEWKQNVLINKKKKCDIKDDIILEKNDISKQEKIFHVINEIKEWETIHKTMLETYMFFTQIQNKIKKI